MKKKLDFTQLGIWCSNHNTHKALITRKKLRKSHALVGRGTNFTKSSLDKGSSLTDGEFKSIINVMTMEIRQPFEEQFNSLKYIDSGYQRVHTNEWRS